MKSKYVAVLITDLHFTPSTLDLATAALNHSLNVAHNMNLPLVICGDTLDTKAIIRAECANRLLLIFSKVNIPVYILVGNHDLINEKSKQHSLNFLSSEKVTIIDSVHQIDPIGYLIPYFNDSNELQAVLNDIPKGSRLIMHQGVKTAYMGHYVVDKTSIDKEAFADYRVLSGHYHRKQDIICGTPQKNEVGMFTYLGTPYSTSFAEADDGPKGFHLLREDGVIEQVETNLRKHVIVCKNTQNLYENVCNIIQKDLLWVKVKGTQNELSKVNKKKLGLALIGHDNYKLELIAEDTVKTIVEPIKTKDALLDDLIESTSENQQQKTYLKALWREVLNETR